MTVLNANVEELQAALDIWLSYKGDLEAQRRLQQGGFTIETTKMEEFKGRIDTASRRVMSALGTDNEMELESLGEILLNCCANMRAQRKNPQHQW